MVELKDIKKKKNKYILVFSDYELEVFEEVIIKFMLLKKRNLEIDEYNELIKYSNYVNGLHLAINYLKKPRSVLETKNYLKGLKIYDKEIINKLLDMGLLNDKLYMEMYVDYQARINLKGPKLIKKELELKGIFLDFTYPIYEENINKLIDRYLKNNKDKPTKKLNYDLNNYLITKGYDKTNNYFYNDDNLLIEDDIRKLKIKLKKYDSFTLKKKMYSSLLNKGYESSLINEYLDKL